MAVQISGNDITVPRDGSFTRNVTIGGTLTYEDVTNIDSVGLVTARTGIEIGARPGVAASISVDGNMIVSGISTFGGDVQVPDKIIHSGDTNTAIRFPAADTITAETGGSERIRIASDGAFGIGHNSPGQLLSLKNTSAQCQQSLTAATNGSCAIYLGDTDSVNRSVIYHHNTGDYLAFYTAASERLRITSDGKLGLGVASPQAVMHIEGGSEGNLLQLSNTNTGATNSDGLVFGINSSSTYIFNRENTAIRIGTNNTERVRIDSSGNLGLGIDAPTAASSETALHIYANEYPEVHLTSSVTGSNAGDGAIFTLNNDSSAIIRNQENSYIRFDTNGSNERVRIHAGGTVNIPSGITLGESISDTSADNTLDDYEEGTFTPVMKFGGGNTGMSTGSMEAVYTKIGRMVFATIRFTMTGKGSSTGHLTFEGLPHTVGDVLSTTSVQGGFLLQYFQGGVTSLHEVMAYPWEGTTVLKVYQRSSGNNPTSTFTDSNITGTFDGRISFFYTANN